MTSERVVHVIDDDQGVLQSLSFLFRMSGVTARTYADPTEFLESAAGLAAGCIVTDVRMPQMNGLDLLRRLREIGVRLPVIVITGHGDVPMAVEAMKAGATDFLEKPFTDDALLAAVESAMAASPQDAKLLARVRQLSAREREVLEALLAGQGNKAVGRALGISDRTVEIYRAKLMAKMGADSFAELIRMALKAGVEAAAD